MRIVSARKRVIRRGTWRRRFVIVIDPGPGIEAEELRADLEAANVLQTYELCWFGRRVRIVHGAAPLEMTAELIEEQGKYLQLAALLRAIPRRGHDIDRIF